MSSRPLTPKMHRRHTKEVRNRNKDTKLCAAVTKWQVAQRTQVNCVERDGKQEGDHCAFSPHLESAECPGWGCERQGRTPRAASLWWWCCEQTNKYTRMMSNVSDSRAPRLPCEVSESQRLVTGTMSSLTVFKTSSLSLQMHSLTVRDTVILIIYI